MLTVSFRRTAFLLLLVAFLATPWASAAGLRLERPLPVSASEPPSWDLLDRVWSFLQGVWGDAGVEPEGRGGPALPGPEEKTGCEINPNGSCHK